MMKHLRIVAVFGLVVPLAGCAYLHGNFQRVGEGPVYRSGQLSTEGLARRLEEHNIRTVVSLRGPAPEEGWYRQERALCERRGVTHITMPWSKEELPEPDSLQRLVELYQTTDAPVLVHCQGGTHRSGVAGAVYVLTQGGTPEEAREQFNVFFNDARIGRVIDLYEGSGMPFELWAHERYPAAYDEAASTAGADDA